MPDARRPTPPAPRRSCGPALALALDVDDLVAAQRLAGELRPWFGVAKVGLELYSAAGPEVIGRWRRRLRGLRRPQAARHPHHGRPRRPGCSGSLGASYLTVHARGGVDSSGRGRRPPRGRRRRAGAARPWPWPSPCSPATPARPPHILAERVGIAEAAGCGGMVCAASDLAEVAPARPRPAHRRARHPARGRRRRRPGPAGHARGGHRRRRRRAGHRPGRHQRRRSGGGRRGHRRRGRRRPLTVRPPRQPATPSWSTRCGIRTDLSHLGDQLGVAGPSGSRREVGVEVGAVVGHLGEGVAQAHAPGWGAAARAGRRPRARRRRAPRARRPSRPGCWAITAPAQAPTMQAHRRPGEPGDQGDGDAEDAELVLVPRAPSRASRRWPRWRSRSSPPR